MLTINPFLTRFQTFSANTNKNKNATINFPVPITTRLIRIRPTDCVGMCSLRFEILGCEMGKIRLLRVESLFIRTDRDSHVWCKF